MPVLQSNLLPAIFKRLDLEKRIIVLDMGRAVSSTVSFFNHFKCRLSFVDIYSEQFIVCPDVDSSHEELVAQVTKSLNLDANTKIDICLFWDLFNYLNDAMVRALIEALEPHINHSTSGYVIGTRDSRNQLPFFRYGIVDKSNLIENSGSGTQGTIYPRSQRDLNRLVDYFEIDRGRLLSEGRAEYLIFENRDSDKSDKSII
ncbi:MAG: hypothetical protein O2950_03845 [Proteobacteria bacterium]|jgi:hypothetical protein|uniref:Class I SAM-dependent methyltransferase n=1 Tax=SAR92 bacterium BACL26 MAG-121220-bin70 TaxID=1655626 RepID=A0A0R2UH83_9GAMM|nr:MAG: hypothetical protein ABS24_03395 [SAR92 bacterium BACL26 MAG-121220-bin70]MDA0795262.1 hypothetical protein [Pseudomonadota bacterium]MDA1351404.1 hypothetical protein [Pseudomonadota bacterium]|tara:strand:- start:5 stop:610 length:606 start_codon:yes stop_codon:yes gene_type:complete